MKIKNRKSKIENPRAGFTLLELLVAISILVMIVLMMSGVFFQSRVAWGSGLRRARMSMEGRAVIDFMANELAQAVADDVLVANIGNNSTAIEFYTLNDAEPLTRSVRRISYRHQGNTIQRQVAEVDFGDPYPVHQADASSELARQIGSLRFDVPAGGPANYSTELPRWVDIELQVEHEDFVSRVSARSAGRDQQWDTADDIQTQ